MIKGAIQHGTLVAVIALIVCVLGVSAAFRVPVQMIPDLSVRTVSVETSWPGTTPQDVEKEILIEQEEYLRTIPNLIRMKATASTGRAEIELEFPPGIDENEVLIEVDNALSQVPSYPENVNEPRVVAASFSENSFMYFRVRPLAEHPVDLDIDLLRDFVDDHVRTRMERVPGVSQVNVQSGAERQVQIHVDPARLAASGITLSQLRQVIRARNRDVSAGDLDAGKRRYLLRTVGRFADLQELEDLIIARSGDAVVRLSDVATVRLDHYELRRLAYIDGEPAIGLSVRRKPGSNVIAIQDALLPVVDDIEEDLLAPMGLDMVLTGNDVRYVEASVRNVWQNLALGALLATLVMFAFLRRLSGTLTAVVGIPICTIAAFIGLLLAGRTINVISLAGVAFAIGMTLDNSIVVLENIKRMREEGMARAEAALQGAREVWPAVLASSATTVLVFAPVVLIQEEAGELFSDIAVAISASILASMLVAITVVPALSVRVDLGVRADLPTLPRRWGIVAGVGWLLATPMRRAGVMVGTVVVTGLALVLLTPPAEYLPEGEEPKTFSQMIAPPGYSLNEMRGIAEELHAELVPHVGADRGPFARGETHMPPVRYLNSSVASERIRIIAEPERPRDIHALMDGLEKTFEGYPGMRTFSARGSIITSNDGGTRSVNLDITGIDMAALYATAERAYRLAEAAFDGPQIGSEPSSLTLGQPLIEVLPDWDRAAELGFTAQELGYGVAALTDGAYVDEFLLGDDNVDMFLYSSEGTNQALASLEDLPLSTPRGEVVTLGAVADLVETVNTGSIRRIDGERTVTLNVIPPRSVALETAVGIVERDVVDRLRGEGIPEGVSIDISGASDDLKATRTALLENFAISVVLAYLLLVAIFRHWGYPLIIMASVPLGIAGGIGGLALLNAGGGLLALLGLGTLRQPFDMITMLGFLILLGTVVNNPILIVDRTLQNLREHPERGSHEAVMEAVSARLRPVIMSTVSTVCGIAPLVFIPGAGTELYRGVGAIVLFGLLFATVVTIVFLPSLLVTVLAALERIGRRPGQRAEGTVDAAA